MNEDWLLQITLKKTVLTKEDGIALFELVKDKLKDYPKISLTGYITNIVKLPVETEV